MKKIFALTVLTLSVTAVFAQDSSRIFNDRASLMLQLGSLQWNGMPDTINKKGLSKSFNAYLMLDFPFKNSPKMSMAVGLGIGSDHMLFSETKVGIKDLTPSFQFTNVSDTDHFKKTKLATSYLEIPVEFRFSAIPGGYKGIKAAIGVKVGTMLNAHTRNTKLQDKNDKLLNEFVMKESSKRFFNKNRLVVTGRLGYGFVSLYGSYQVTALLKDGAGPDVRPFSIGLTVSGL